MPGSARDNVFVVLVRMLCEGPGGGVVQSLARAEFAIRAETLKSWRAD
jgi:hypothetical protein